MKLELSGFQLTDEQRKLIMDTHSESKIADDHQDDRKTVQQAPPPIIRVPVKHVNLGIRSHAMDMSTMVELTTFSSLGKIQPFLVTISATAALLVDIHCHLTDKEVCGYLGGHWDVNAHNLSILGAYPCRYAGKDNSAAAAVESEISKAMEWKRMTLVGWYHSHPRTHASPSLRDVDAQLDYQIKMKGPSDNGYIPCVGLICSPYHVDSNSYESNFNVFWSMPPPENRPHEYPRPMLLSYTLTHEQYVSQDALEEIKKSIEYYKFEGGIDFTSKFNANITYLERMKNSIMSKLPNRDKRTNASYWDLIKEMVAPGFDDGSESPFANIKFPFVNDPVMQATGVAPATNVFITPVNFKAENSNSAPKSEPINQQSEMTSEGTNNKDSSSSSKSESAPVFRAGEVTVSLKNAKNEYGSNLTDFSKIESLKNQSEYPISDLSQAMKFPDLAKLANLSPAELAKLTGLSLGDFTKAASSSNYARNIANLFNPLAKDVSDPSEVNERKTGDLPDITIPFKPPKSSSPAPKDLSHSLNSAPEDYSSSEKKRSVELMDTSSSFSGIDDLSLPSSKVDYNSTIDMTTKKHHSMDCSDTLDLSSDKQKAS
ncbi:hypothetical protein QAD02_024120 [Eretmocerus hayati]|uniref:Uncharacterized protein n=1 Tax=Eretmocerus hayati TaxID=131215 RepID=A0ACC2PY45_9HYME|nr:hypothetical protein QAD02_024120 [Eretmocerus hayati]